MIGELKPLWDRVFTLLAILSLWWAVPFWWVWVWWCCLPLWSPCRLNCSSLFWWMAGICWCKNLWRASIKAQYLQENDISFEIHYPLFDATILKQGAQLIHFQPKGGDSLLWSAELSTLKKARLFGVAFLCAGHGLEKRALLLMDLPVSLCEISPSALKMKRACNWCLNYLTRLVHALFGLIRFVRNSRWHWEKMSNSLYM